MAKDRLYYDNPMIWQFDAEVLNCSGPHESADGRTFWKVKLSPNAFYPESGGQPSDRGSVAGSEVFDVTEDEDGSVSVMVASHVSGRVRCMIDGTRRFDFMQQHTGQHILSAAFERLFGFETVGFHLGDECCTVDLETEKLEDWQADRAEDASNDVIFENLPVFAEFVDAERLETMNLRKPPKVDKDIRIVTVEGFDNCPCGGTHVARTGEIGIIKITRVDRAKGKVRLELLCGRRALMDYRRKNRQLLKAAASLSVHPAELEAQLDRLTGQAKEMRKSLHDTSMKLMDYEAAAKWAGAEPYKGIKVIVHNAGSGGMDDAKQFALRLAANAKTAAVVGASGQDNAYLVVARSQDATLDAAAAFRPAVALLDGRGGGNPGLAQGGGNRIASLPEAIEEAGRQLRGQLDRQ